MRSNSAGEGHDRRERHRRVVARGWRQKSSGIPTSLLTCCCISATSFVTAGACAKDSLRHCTRDHPVSARQRDSNVAVMTVWRRFTAKRRIACQATKRPDDRDQGTAADPWLPFCAVPIFESAQNLAFELGYQEV